MDVDSRVLHLAREQLAPIYRGPASTGHGWPDNIFLDESDFGHNVTRAPEQCWIADIPTADEIEQRLWADYEHRFAEKHERVQAYRYEPADEAEAAIVLKFFPPVVFQLKGEKSFQVT